MRGEEPLVIEILKVRTLPKDSYDELLELHRIVSCNTTQDVELPRCPERSRVR